MTPSRDLRPSGVPYSNGEPNPPRCQLWSWVDGKHVRCDRYATVESAVPGRITLQTCAMCMAKRELETAKETKHDH